MPSPLLQSGSVVRKQTSHQWLCHRIFRSAWSGKRSVGGCVARIFQMARLASLWNREGHEVWELPFGFSLRSSRRQVLQHILRVCVCFAKPKHYAVARDSIARGMSPFSDRASCCIHFTWGSLETLPELPPLLEALENVLRPFNPRPHYGKLVFGSFQSHSLAHSLPVDSLDE